MKSEFTFTDWRTTIDGVAADGTLAGGPGGGVGGGTADATSDIGAVNSEAADAFRLAWAANRVLALEILRERAELPESPVRVCSDFMELAGAPERDRVEESSGSNGCA